MPLKLSVKVTTPDSQLKKFILQGIADHLTITFKAASPRIKSRIQELVKRAIITSPEYISLTTSKLKGELGVVDAAKDMETIINIWLESYVVNSDTVQVVGNGFRGGFESQMIQGDFKDVIYNFSAKYYTDKGLVIPWLEWLLVAGQAVLVKNYKVLFKGGLPASRTGLAIMVKSASSNYKFSGLGGPNFEDDNMVTRAIKNIESDVEQILFEEIQRNI